MHERQRRTDRELAEADLAERSDEAAVRVPGRRARAALYEAALGTRRRGAATPGKVGRGELGRTWLPAPGTITPDQVWQRLAMPAGLRAAASAADAALQDEINAGGAARDAAIAAIAAAQDPGHALPVEVAARMAAVLGHSFAHVRVHTGPAAAAAATALGARAFTLGHHIYFADGELAPGTASGDRLLRHELTHVVQFDQGRLRGHGGGLEVADRHSATEVEARAAEDLPAGARAANGNAPAPTAAPDAKAADARTPGPAPDGKADVASRSIGGAMMDVVRLVSPRLATLIEQGLEGSITTLVHDAIRAGIAALVPAGPLAALTAVGGSIADIASTLIGAAQGDAQCCATFKRWCEKLGALARKGATSKFVEDFKRGFDQVDHLVAGVVRAFGGALVDGFRAQLAGLRDLGSDLVRLINAVASRLRAAADFVLRQLRLPSIAQIEATLTRLAETVFATIKRGVAAAIAGLQALARALYELSGLQALVELFRYAGQLIEVTRWLLAHRNDADIVRHAREQMAHTFLPRLLESMGGLVGKIQAAIAWGEQHVGLVLGILGSVGGLLIGPLVPLAAAIAGVAVALRAMWGTIAPALTGLWTDVKALAVKVFRYAQPVIDTFVQVATLISNPLMAPVIIASSAWLVLPECFKGPLIDLFLDLLIALLQASPNAVALFGPLWRFVRAGAISFFETIRATWSTPDKITAVNRLAHLGSGRNAEALAGFVIGFFKGVVYGVIDPFKMVYELLKMAYDVGAFFGKLAARYPQLAPIIARYLPQLEARAQEILASGRQALDDFLAGKIGFDELWQLLLHFLDAVEAKAQSVGAAAAGKLKGWVLGGITDYDIGETIGIAVGFIIVFLLIMYFSAGISAEAEGALGVVRTIAKVLNAPYELLGAALKPLEALFKPVTSALAAFGARVGLKALWDGALKAIEKAASLLGRMVEELIVAIEGRLAARAATVLEAITARIGAELAEKLVAELGEKAAQELVDKLGDQLIRELGERALSGAQIEHLASVFEKEGLEHLIAEGLTGPELVRLGALDEATLRKLLIDLDAREVLALEEQLGRAELERLSQTMTGPQLQAALEAAGPELTRRLTELGLSGPQIQHLAGVFERDGLEHLLAEGLTGPELIRLGALDKAALRRLLLGLDAREVLALEAALGKAGLERLAGDLEATRIKALVDMLGPDAIKGLLEHGLTGAEIDRMVTMFGKDGAEILIADGLTGDELRRLLALEESTLTKLMADLDAREVLALEAQLGKRGLDRAAEGLSAFEIRDWIADFGAARVRELAEKYGGEAMKFYGKDFFRQYLGITGQTEHHLTPGDGISDGKVKGTHDWDDFMTQFVNPTPPRVVVRNSRVVGDLEEIEYSLMKADLSGPKAAINKKTLMHGLSGRMPTLMPLVNAELERQIAARTFPRSFGAGPAFSAAGYRWNYFFRDWYIHSVFPVL